MVLLKLGRTRLGVLVGGNEGHRGEDDSVQGFGDMHERRVGMVDVLKSDDLQLRSLYSGFCNVSRTQLDRRKG